ncbi:hypothetical protein ACSAZL_18810 [Methanosarcina sp. T3]|uniref:hypothetical protein n=1 Tax=Methanosarcina sp. T3 TaxID=3439062 RepID=UPI003F828589
MGQTGSSGSKKKWGKEKWKAVLNGIKQEQVYIYKKRYIKIGTGLPWTRALNFTSKILILTEQQKNEMRS